MTASVCWVLVVSGTPRIIAQEETPKDRVVSSHLAAVFSEVMPKFSPAAPAAAVTTNDTSPEANRATVIRLPEYIVREQSLPTREDVTTDYIKTREAVHHYFGEEESLYRTLNVVTISGLWAKIPILGKYPFIVGQFFGTASGGASGPTTTEQRALDRYRAEKRAEEWENLTSLESPKLSETKE